jgi:hypothetical protein
MRMNVIVQRLAALAFALLHLHDFRLVDVIVIVVLFLV